MIQSALLKLNSLLAGGMKLSSLFGAEGDVVSTVDPTQVQKGLFITVSEALIAVL